MLKQLITSTILSTLAMESDSKMTQTPQSYLPPVFAQEDRLVKIQALFPEIDAMYREYAEENHFSGYAYGILLDGKLVHYGNGGFSDLDKKTAATPQSMFRIASMTKSFIAMAILKLRDEGKLRLDDPIDLYIPEMQKTLFTADAPVITLRDLLIHSAGLPTDDPWADRKLDETEEEFSVLLNRGFTFSNVPGVAFEYSNLGYALLGYIIKKITGAPCSEFISITLCHPIGMTESSWEFTEIPEAKLAQGYRWLDREWKKEALLQDGAFGPIGGIITSIEAFSHYVAIHQLAWPPRDERELGPIKRSSLREMHQPWKFKQLTSDFKYTDGRECTLVSAYGYGLQWLRDSFGRVFVGHSGGLPGFGSNWYIMPEYGLGVVLFANTTYAPASKVNLNVLDKLVVKAQLKPRQLPPSRALKEKKEALLKLLPHWEKAETSAIFANNFFLDNSLDALKFESNELFLKVGKILAIGELIPENQLRGYFTVEGEKGDLRIDFSLTPENPCLIQQYQIKEITN